MTIFGDSGIQWDSYIAWLAYVDCCQFSIWCICIIPYSGFSHSMLLSVLVLLLLQEVLCLDTLIGTNVSLGALLLILTLFDLFAALFDHS